VEETHRRVERTSQRAHGLAGAAGATYRSAARVVERFIRIKQRELEAHLTAVKLHEQAAELQERLGHPDRAAEARAHADQARNSHRVAVEELVEYQARISAARDRSAGETSDRPARPPG
jgi:hypothetical protein